MDSLRNSLWSVIGLTSTASLASADKCLPIDLLANLESARLLSNEISVAERNLTTYKDQLKGFGSAYSMTVNDLTQLSSYCVVPDPKFGDSLIAKAAELNHHASTLLQTELTNRVLEPLMKWRVTIDELIVRIEEQRRMHHQQGLLRDHIREREEGRVRLMKTGRWTIKDGAELKKAQDALVSWKLKTEAVDCVVAECVQRDLIEARKQNGLQLLKVLDEIDQKFWRLGGELCKLRAKLIDTLETPSRDASHTTIKKKKKPKKQPAEKERVTGEKPDGNKIVVDNSIPDILSSFEYLRFEPDPFSPVEDDARISVKSKDTGAVSPSPGDPFHNLHQTS